MKLTHENYYSLEANRAFMSVSQFKAFDRCEAAALAELRGEYKPAPSTAMLVGSYVDAYVSGDLEAFKAEHPEIFKRAGSLKADFAAADEITKRITWDGLFRRMVSGGAQEIRTGEIAGVPFKCKIDSLLLAEQVGFVIEAFPDTAPWFGLGTGAIVDLKVMRDFAPMWAEGQQVPFVVGWAYDLQGAVYQAIEGHGLPFFIAAVSKETPADLAVIAVDQSSLDARLREVEARAPRYQAIKDGRVQPTRCERCAYCRQTRRLTSFVDYREMY